MLMIPAVLVLVYGDGEEESICSSFRCFRNQRALLFAKVNGSVLFQQQKKWKYWTKVFSELCYTDINSHYAYYR